MCKVKLPTHRKCNISFFQAQAAPFHFLGGCASSDVRESGKDKLIESAIKTGKKIVIKFPSFSAHFSPEFCFFTSNKISERKTFFDIFLNAISLSVALKVPGFHYFRWFGTFLLFSQPVLHLECAFGSV